MCSTLCRDCGIDAWNQWDEQDDCYVHEDFYVHNDVWERVCPVDENSGSKAPQRNSYPRW